MSLPLRLIVLALPLAGLGWIWSTTRHAAQAGVEWEVPVTGYDPRDLLSGHYIRYAYVWPGQAEGEDLFATGTLCLIGHAPHIDNAYALPANVPARGCDGVVRAGSAPALRSGRVYVSEQSVNRLQAALANPRQQVMLRFRLHQGAITPITLQP